MARLSSVCFIFALLQLLCGLANAQSISFQNKYVKLVIEKDGRVSGLFDQKTGKNYISSSPVNYIASIKQDGRILSVASVQKTKSGLTLTFDDSSATAELSISSESSYIIFEVSNISSDKVQEFCFLDINLIPQKNDSAFSWAAIAMNLHTNVPALPGMSNHLLASCSSNFGIKGAKAAVIGSPSNKMRSIMKEVVYAAKDDVPYSPYGGPWAMDHKFNKGSYIVDCMQIRKDTVDKWIKICSDTGIHQIDISNWNFFNGEYEVNPEYIHGGKEELKQIINRLHTAGIRCGLHTYSFLVGKHSRKYLKPYPDPRLLKGAKFSLSTDIDTDDTNILVETNPDIEKISVQGSAGFIVQIDNELVTVGSVSKTTPYTLMGCTRGVLGTKVSDHSKNSNAAEVRQVYDMFLPDVHTTLFKEIAHNIARLYNECGFDMMYLDAVDSYGLLDSAENGWYWSTLFVNEIVKNIKKPAMLEGSTLWHGLWFARSRMGAWDVPIRAEKECYDAHFVDNMLYKKTFLPTHLGWCDIHKWSPIQPERTFMDDVEYLLCKGMAADSGISMQSYLNPDNYTKNENAPRVAKLIKSYELLRTKHYFPESVKQKLAISGADYTLEQNKNHWFFRPVTYDKHRAGGYDQSTYIWNTINKYSSQPVQLRIEALMSIDPYDSPDASTLTDYSNVDFKQDQVRGIASSSFTPGAYPETGRTGPMACFRAVSNDSMSWVSYAAKLIYGNDCSMKGFGFWVYGDGQDEIVNLQTTSVPSCTGYNDHYVKVNFTGWKYFEFVEPETTDMSKYDWPSISKKSEWAYTENGPSTNELRLPPSATACNYYIMYGAVNYVTSVGIWYNNMPVGKQVTTYLSPVKTLPLRTVKIQNPSVTIAGKKVSFPTTLESGQYLEYRSMVDCRVYNAEGAVIANIKPVGEAPIVNRGSNKASFSCKSLNNTNPRINVTVITKGDPISK